MRDGTKKTAESDNTHATRSTAHPFSPVFYMPENLHIEAVLPPELKKHADCGRYLVHLITREWAWRTVTRVDFVPLMVEHLRKIIPLRKERQIRHALIEGGVIECDGHYIKGSKALGYRLAPQYRTLPTVTPITDKRIFRKLEARYYEIMKPVHFHLRGWLERLEIETDEAKRVASSLDEPRLHLNAIDRISDGHVEFWICSYGRVHTLPTRLSKHLRPFLRLKGRPLVELDLANCQPLLLGLSYFSKRNRNTREGKVSPGSGASGSSTLPAFPRDPIMMCTSQDRDELPEDAQAYLCFCEGGHLYEHLACVGGETREWTKHRLFVDLLCGKNKYGGAIKDLFSNEFPSIAAFIREEKRHEYRTLGRELQRVESHLMIGRVCNRLRVDHPSVPLITIHDGLLVTQQDVELVSQIIKEEFQAFGIMPSLRVKEPAREDKAAGG